MSSPLVPESRVERDGMVPEGDREVDHRLTDRELAVDRITRDLGDAMVWYRRALFLTLLGVRGNQR